MPVTTLRRSPGLSRGLIHGDFLRIRRDRGLDQQPLEGMIVIPVIDDVLVVPHDLAGVGVQGQRGVVVQVGLVVAGEDELRRRNRHRRAHENQVSLRVVARHHPGADVPALGHRHVAPGLVAGLARQRDRARPPHFLARLRVVRGDDAGVVAGVGLALAAGNHLAVGDDRTGARARALLRVHHRAFPTPGCRCARPPRRSGCRRCRR